MADYFNSDAVKQALNNECVKCIHFPVCSRLMGGMNLERCEDFKNAADVVEVRYGEWEMREDEHVYWFVCSCCGERPPKDMWKDEWLSLYCPSCGAKMNARGEG